MRQTSLGDVLRMASEKPPELWVAGARMLGFEPADSTTSGREEAPPVSPLARPDEDESIRPVTARTHAPSGVADESGCGRVLSALPSSATSRTYPG